MAPQVESNINFSRLPQDIELGHVEHDDQQRPDCPKIPCDEDSRPEVLMLLLRFAIVVMLFVGLAFRQGQLNQLSSDPVPPKFFLNSLYVPHFNISDGELYATWDVKLTISNVMNATTINIEALEAAVSHKESETLAVVTHINPGNVFDSHVLPIGAEEEKGLHLKLNTTGWEEDQPTVDDTVIAAMAEERKRGVVGFGLQMRVRGELEFGGWVKPFVMYPKCSDLIVQFVPPEQGDKAATLIDGKSRECLGHIEWGGATGLFR